MMIKCKECGQQISDKADKCPHCGYKRKSAGCGFYLFLILVLLVFIWKISDTSAPHNANPVATNPAPPVTADPKGAAEQLKNIKQLIAAGYFAKVEKISEYPHVYIMPKFRDITIDNKRLLLATVILYYQYSEGRRVELLGIYDGQTGKHIGRYDGYNLNID